MSEKIVIRKMPETGGETKTVQSGALREAQAMRETIRHSADALPVRGQVYYVSENGSNENDGRTPETAFRTLDAVRSLCYELKAGDTVLLERGSVFRLPDGLDLTDGVSYGAYGTGPKPEVYGSYMNYAREGVWTPGDRENIWKIGYFPHSDAGIVVFDHGAAAGTKRSTLQELVKNGDFFHDWEEHILYLYCDKGNPGAVYRDIEIGVMTRMFHLKRGAHDITVDNICLKYTGLFAVRADGDCRNITITNCEIAWLGGSLFGDGSNRFGNGIEFSSGCDNVRIENCWFYQIFDSGATFQIGTRPFRRFTVRRCLFEYTGMGGFEWWSSGGDDAQENGVPLDSTVIEDICIEENIMRLNGYGWSGATRSPCHIRGTWTPRNYAHLKNFRVARNIFDCCRGYIMACAWTAPPEGYILQDNAYYQAPTKRLHPEDPGSPAFDMVLGHPTFARCQEELEAAVRQVEESPRLVKWLE